MKSCCAVLAVALVAFCLPSAYGSDQLFGVVSSTDSLIATETITKVGIPGFVVTKDYTFVQPSTTTTYTVNAIKVIDNKRIKGATASVYSGSISSTAITIRLTSKRGAGIKSTIEVYGSE